MEFCKDIGAWEKIINNSLDIICTLDRNGFLMNINEACKSVLGYESEEVRDCHFSSFIHPEDLPDTFTTIQEVINGLKINSFKNRCIHKSGKKVPFLWSAVWSEEDQVILCIGRDITEQELVRHKDELYQAMVEHGSDLLTLFDEQLNYLYCGGSTVREHGYKPEQLIGTNLFSYVHPEDVPIIKDSLSKVLVSKGHIKVSEVRFKDARGKWRWYETTLSNQLQNPAVKALVSSSRDITDRIKNSRKLQESEQRFKSLFDHHLDMVLFQNRDGVIVDVNPATLSFFGIRKQDALNQPFSDFLSSEIIPFCDKIFQDAVNGESLRFEKDIPFKGKGLLTFDIVKIPVKLNGAIIGVYSVLRDISEISLSNLTIRRQAEKMNSTLESITDGFCTLDKNWKFTYINSEFENLFAAEREKILGNNIWKAFPDLVNSAFFHHINQAATTDKAAHFNFYSHRFDKWLEVRAYPSEEGLSLFMDDVTERINSRNKLEKLSLVARKTINGVVILNAEGRAEWVNEGFPNLTGYTFSEVEGKFPGTLLAGEETEKTTVERIKENLKHDKPFQEEVLIYKKAGEKAWLSLDFTPVLDDSGKVVNFIELETDITFRKEAEARHLLLTHDLIKKNRDLQQFNSIVSHNLRSPVASAMGLAEFLITANKDSEDFNILLAHLKSRILHLDSVLKDLNTFLSIRDKGSGIEKESIQLSAVCQQVIEEMQEPLEQCSGEVIMSIKENVYVEANRTYLCSIFYNLLSNAITYRSPKRLLKINIKCISSKNEGSVISLSDNGSGFDMNLAKDKIFQPYKRFHTNFEGRGIGLFLTKTYLEAMGGHIEVTSQGNVGTKFLIYLK